MKVGWERLAIALVWIGIVLTLVLWFALAVLAEKILS